MPDPVNAADLSSESELTRPTPSVAGIPEDQSVILPNEPEEVLFAWEGPNRVFKARKREYYVNIAIIIFLLCVLAYFAAQYFLIALMVSVGFLNYVFAAVPPTQILYQITTYGIRMGRQLYPWETLSRFWMTLRFDTTLLHIEHTDPLFRRITLIVPQEYENDITQILSLILPNEQPAPTSVERAARWLEEKFPLERE